MEFKIRTITADDGATLVVWDNYVTGEPVVFVHGFPETHLCWHPVLSAFDSEEIRRYRLIMYDLRGFGESSKVGEASLNRFYCDHDTIVSKLKLRQYHLVGHDWGGAVALHVSRFKPETLISLAVMNTNYWKTDILGMWHMIFFNIPFLPPISLRLIPGILFKFGMLGAFVDKSRLTQEAKNSYLQMFHDPGTTRYWTRLYRTMARSLISQKVRVLKFFLPQEMIGLPDRSDRAYQNNVALIWGEKDRFIPQWICRDMVRQLEKRGATVSGEIISDSGHFVQEEQPELVAKILIEHWRKCSPVYRSE